MGRKWQHGGCIGAAMDRDAIPSSRCQRYEMQVYLGKWQSLDEREIILPTSNWRAREEKCLFLIASRHRLVESKAGATEICSDDQPALSRRQAIVAGRESDKPWTFEMALVRLSASRYCVVCMACVLDPTRQPAQAGVDVFGLPSPVLGPANSSLQHHRNSSFAMSKSNFCTPP